VEGCNGFWVTLSVTGKPKQRAALSLAQIDLLSIQQQSS
jgi:hypothetical protein